MLRRPRCRGVARPVGSRHNPLARGTSLSFARLPENQVPRRSGAAAKEETMRRFFLAAVGSRRRITWAAVIVSLLAVGGGSLYLANRERAYDPRFDARVAEPAYRTER